MLRLVLLVLYLAASLSAPQHTKIGGGLDPDGLTAPPTTKTVDIGGGWDPNGNR
jgi:cation transporter-like permease